MIPIQIKTPLTAITIMTDLLKQPDLPKEKRIEFVEKIDRQTSKITWLIRNLLTLSQLEADVLKLHKESVEIYDILRSVCQSLELLAELRGVVKNCVEHTPAGGRVSISVMQNNFGTNITIKDNGDGIAGEDLPHIFERFYKGKHGSKESVGIGLALARQIILRQNGTIQVQSVEGEGSIFLVRLYVQ